MADFDSSGIEWFYYVKTENLKIPLAFKMSDILSLADTLEPNAALFKGDLQKIAKIHVLFYKFYIKFASKCDALLYDKRSQDYLESCIDFLENKKLTRKGIQQSRSNCLKMLDSLNDLCVTLNCDKKMLVGMHKLIDQAVIDDEGKGEGTLDLLKQLKNLLNATGDTNDNDDNNGNGNDGRISPESTGSSTPEQESSRSRGGVEPMMQYLLSDSGMDSYYHKYNKDVKNFALTSQMNQIMPSANDLRENTYSGLDNLLAKMKINVPIWNYHVDRVDTIDSSNVMENMEIFGGNKSVTDAVLYSCPDYLTVGPFDVYVRNKVFVYHCLVNNCNNCMTTSLEFLKLHVKFQHGDSDVDWNCTDCELIKLHSSCQKSLDGALDHLAKHHSIKSTYTLAKERLLEINQKIIGEDLSSSNICPQPKPEIISEDNTDLFHCPNTDCGFSTNSMSVAFGHYAFSLDKNMTVQCRYCSLISYSTYELCEHLVKDHGNAKYKCGHCPYRSVSKANCVYHQRDLHPVLPSKILGFEQLSNAEYKYSCRAHNTIKPFVCNEACNFGTMVEQKFNQHILTHPGMMVTCHYCEKYHTTDMDDLRDHFLIHGVGEYHCTYCREAFNFIAKIQLHLHQHHPSQYPFMIICQDYDTRSVSLKGMYNKVQKLELGGESIVVLPLESDKGVHTANVISHSESILIEDVDHCKMQLKTFMKNKEEPEEIPYAPPLPHIEETLDLTTSEDPKERVDIKPRLRVRTVEELQAPFVATDFRQPVEPAEVSPAMATFYAFSEPMESTPSSEQSGQGFPTAMLTPAQIKQERLCGAVDNEVTVEKESEHPNTDALISSIQIKKEVLETSRPAGKSNAKPQSKSPRKMKPKQTVNPVHVKTEAAESREMEVDTPSPQPLVIDERNEDQDAVAALISQEARRRTSISDGEGGRTPSRNVPDDSGLRISNAAVQGSLSTAAVPTAESAVPSDMEIQGGISTVVSLAPSVPYVTASYGTSSDATAFPLVASDGLMNEIVMGTSGNAISEIVLNPSGQNINAPILNEASIDNIPVDFDCAVPGSENPDLDTKQFAVDSEGNLTVRPLYADRTVVDTVIISSEGEDDYEDVRASPVSTPSSSRPTTPSSASNLTHSRPSPISSAIPTANPSPPNSKSSNMTIVPKLTRIFPAPQRLNSSPQKIAHTVLVVDPRAATTTVGQIKPIQVAPAIRSAPIVDVKRFRCKLCSFASEDRQVTYNHLTVAHPNRFSKQIRDAQTARVTPEETLVRAVSCPYCPDVVYEGIKSFERHHAQHHCDFTEVKCFLVYNPAFKQHLSQIFACSFCGHFCRDEEFVWQHIYAVHSARLASLKKPLNLKCTVALKKMVCPLYNCLDEFLDPTAFRTHVTSHPEVIACKKCTYIADSVEEFQKFHLKIEPEDRLLHFYYTQSVDERANLLNVQRFSNPLYSLSNVYFKEKTAAPSTPATPLITVRKTTARKSTGGAQHR